MTGGVIGFLLGGFLLFYGSVAFRSCLFPLMFLGFAIPIPERLLGTLVWLLQKGSAETVSLLFSLTGTPVYRPTDLVFAVPNLTIEIAEACSGIRSTLGMVIVTFLAAHLFLRSSWRKTALILAVIPISLVKNAVRIVTLTLLAIHYDMSFITGSLHHEGGVLFMAGGLCLMYPVLWFLVRSEEKKSFDSGVRL
jgi:exosortase